MTFRPPYFIIYDMENIICESLPDGGDNLIVDIRDENSFAYGHIENSINVPAAKISEYDFPRGKKLYIVCLTGRKSVQAAEELTKRGFEAYSLAGGYAGWLKACLGEAQADIAQKTEEGIRGRFSKKLFSKFAKAIVTYNLIDAGDKIAVCISGGKDSFLMAKLFQELKRHNKIPFDLVFLLMDPGYSPENREIIERNAKNLNIPLTIFETDIFDSVYNIEKSPCYICARMRRGHLYAKARELGCNKIALGHHYDDVIETILMGMLYGGQMQTMMPRVDSANFKGMRLIRPMYLVREDDIKAWRDFYGLKFLQCACRFTDTCSVEGGANSKRLKVKRLIRALKAEDPEIEQNIFKSAENVNLSTVIAYKDKSGVRHRFTDGDGAPALPEGKADDPRR